MVAENLSPNTLLMMEWMVESPSAVTKVTLTPLSCKIKVRSGTMDGVVVIPWWAWVQLQYCHLLQWMMCPGRSVICVEVHQMQYPWEYDGVQWFPLHGCLIFVVWTKAPLGIKWGKVVQHSGGGLHELHGWKGDEYVGWLQETAMSHSKTHLHSQHHAGLPFHFIFPNFHFNWLFSRTSQLPMDIVITCGHCDYLWTLWSSMES